MLGLVIAASAVEILQATPVTDDDGKERKGSSFNRSTETLATSNAL